MMVLKSKPENDKEVPEQEEEPTEVTVKIEKEEDDEEVLTEDSLDDAGVCTARVSDIANNRPRDKFNISNRIIQGKDLLDYFDPSDKLKIGQIPGEFDRILDRLTESKSRKAPGYCYVITFDDGGKRSVMAAKYGFETKEEAIKALADAESEYMDSPFWDDTVKKSVRLIKESLLDNESLTEAIEWNDLNGTEQSAVEAALAEINNGSNIEDAVHGAVAMYNEENANPDYEDEDFRIVTGKQIGRAHV